MFFFPLKSLAFGQLFLILLVFRETCGKAKGPSTAAKTAHTPISHLPSINSNVSLSCNFRFCLDSSTFVVRPLPTRYHPCGYPFLLLAPSFSPSASSAVSSVAGFAVSVSTRVPVCTLARKFDESTVRLPKNNYWHGVSQVDR